MAYVVRTYECPECKHRWDLLQASEEGPPRFCGKCGTDFGEDELEAVPGTRAIGGSAIARATDGMYRDLEVSSAARAEELKIPALKVTNLNDRQREGDVAAKLPVSSQYQHFERMRASTGLPSMTGFGGGFAQAGGGRVGPPIQAGAGTFVGPGHVALAALQPEHGQKVVEVTSQPLGVYRGGR